jgi:hypothetical protein
VERGAVDLDDDTRLPPDEIEPTEPAVGVPEVDLPRRLGEPCTSQQVDEALLELALRRHVASAPLSEEQPEQHDTLASLYCEIVEDAPQRRDGHPLSRERGVERALGPVGVDVTAEVEERTRDRRRRNRVDDPAVVRRDAE